MFTFIAFVRSLNSPNFFPDSPYGDVSGLPDPYTGHDISDELLRQTGAMNGITGISHDTADMGAMAQHHEGYTNSRALPETK